MKPIFIIAFILVFGITLLLFFELNRFNRWLEVGHKKIMTSQRQQNQVIIQDLPPLLQQYLKKVIINQPSGNYTFFSQSGEFRMKPEDKMENFTAEQYVSIVSPMFSWVAKIPMNSLSIVVCDRLIDNQGQLQARLFSLLPLAKGSGDSFLRGELLRYLAELPWYPVAILNQPEIIWMQTNDNKITGTLLINSVSATVEYTFTNDGLIKSIYVPDREKGNGKIVEKLPWLGEFSDYAEREGILIPLEGKVSWLLESGKFTYFRGRITSYQIKDAPRITH